MYEDLFNKLQSRNALEENIHSVCEGMTWEQIAIALYDILDNIDTADDMCKENSEAFRNMVMKLQARKNEYMFSPDGYGISPVVEIEEVVVTDDPQQKLLNKYKDRIGKLSGSTYPGEGGYKFFVLTDGTVIPVRHTHEGTARRAGLSYDDVIDAGVVDGYIEPARNELDVRGRSGLSKQQVTTLVGMFVPYRIKEVALDLYGKNVYQRVRSSEELDYFLTYGTLDEAVAVALSEPEERLKDYYEDILNGELTKSTWGGDEANQRKFWLLTDGTIVPVSHSHLDTANDAGVEFTSKLYREGALAGYVDEEREEIGIRSRGTHAPTLDQIITVKKLYNEYPVDTIYADMFEEAGIGTYVPTASDLSRFLRTGKAREKKPWESINEDRKEAIVNAVLRNKEEVLSALKKSISELPPRVDAWSKPSKHRPGIVAEKPNPEVSRIRKLARAVKKEDAETIVQFFGAIVQEVEKYSPTTDMSVNESMSDFARKELDLAGMFDKDSDYEGMLGEAVMDLIELFASQGHSGFSAAMTVDLFDRLASYKPLTELTDNPDEWNDVSEFQGGKPGWQSTRSPSCFSNDGGKTYWDIDEDYYKHTDEDGLVWSGGLTEEQWDARPIHTSKHWGED